MRKKRERLRHFRDVTQTRVERSKVNNENDRIRKIEMRENDARKSLLRFATHRPTISKDKIRREKSGRSSKTSRL